MISVSFPKVHYLDLLQFSEQIPSSCYIDRLHLNEPGNTRLNEQIFSTLKNIDALENQNSSRNNWSYIKIIIFISNKK